MRLEAEEEEENGRTPFHLVYGGAAEKKRSSVRQRSSGGSEIFRHLRQKRKAAKDVEDDKAGIGGDGTFDDDNGLKTATVSSAVLSRSILEDKHLYDNESSRRSLQTIQNREKAGSTADVPVINQLQGTDVKLRFSEKSRLRIPCLDALANMPGAEVRAECGSYSSCSTPERRARRISGPEGPLLRDRLNTYPHRPQRHVVSRQEGDEESGYHPEDCDSNETETEDNSARNVFPQFIMSTSSPERLVSLLSISRSLESRRSLSKPRTG